MPHATMERRHQPGVGSGGQNMYYTLQPSRSHIQAPQDNYGSLPSQGSVNIQNYGGGNYSTLPSQHRNMNQSDIYGTTPRNASPLPSYNNFNSLPRPTSGYNSLPPQQGNYGTLPTHHEYKSQTLPHPTRDTAQRQLPAPSLSRHTVKVLQVPFLVVGDVAGAPRSYPVPSPSPTPSSSSTISDPPAAPSPTLRAQGMTAQKPMHQRPGYVHPSSQQSQPILIPEQQTQGFVAGSLGSQPKGFPPQVSAHEYTNMSTLPHPSAIPNHIQRPSPSSSPSSSTSSIPHPHHTVLQPPKPSPVPSPVPQRRTHTNATVHVHPPPPPPPAHHPNPSVQQHQQHQPQHQQQPQPQHQQQHQPHQHQQHQPHQHQQHQLHQHQQPVQHQPHQHQQPHQHSQPPSPLISTTNGQSSTPSPKGFNSDNVVAQQPPSGGVDDFSFKIREMQSEMERMQKQMESQFRNMQMGPPPAMGKPGFPDFPPLMTPPFGSIQGSMDDMHSQGSMNSLAAPSMMEPNFGTMMSNDMSLGAPIIDEQSETKGGKKQLKLNLDMHDFTPEEVKVKSDKNKLEVTAHHEEKDPNRVTCRVFHQQYHLPPNVRMAKMKYDMTPTGELKVEGTVKPRHRVKWAEDTLTK